MQRRERYELVVIKRENTGREEILRNFAVVIHGSGNVHGNDQQ
jgi:hypothetical protein